MSRYELEAQELLLRRRNMLRRQGRGAPGADPAARWTDYEGAAEPVSEGAQRELVEIDAALSRIAEGRYGTCQACGGPMGLQRIRAIPEARFCVGCSGQGLAAD
ncbi:MAG TPA: TraR/DksA C4-type zinc finger protein [Anaeromyxobacteraceae bacterium]|nr:TraR/DksA C4-type zinc finger protein [Anaeromyxobacteraceae bacterium]